MVDVYKRQTETLEIAKNLLLSKSTLNHETVNELINLTKVILEQNYFTFDNKYYLQCISG